MLLMKNDLSSIHILYTGSPKDFRYIMAYEGGGSLRCILTYLSCTKYSDISMRHLNVQKHVSNRK